MDDHLSRSDVTITLKRFNKRAAAENGIWLFPTLLRIGFATNTTLEVWARPQDEHFTLPARISCCGLLSVALSVALRPPAFRWYPLLRSPDFPPPGSKEPDSDHLLTRHSR